ncbi:hypothetical protein CPC08DRAFT_710372 [Agrocybe pediades]|nr:hypothetical protein CPC08DRAFT_710372 [Agrocybe pediades]
MIILFAILAKLLLLLLLCLDNPRYGQEEKEYTYIGNDFPRVWNIDTGRSVTMRFEDTVRFSFEDDETSNLEWDSLSPGRGLIYLGEHKRPFSTSMFHQLRCISIIRTQAIRNITKDNDTSSASSVGFHCLNYLRQMVLCRSDRAIAPISAFPEKVMDYDYAQCRDWTAVYDAVALNQREHAQDG